MQIFSLVTVIFLFALIFTGCGKEQVEIEKPPYVKTQKVSAGNLVTENIYSGTVKGRYETKMSFQVGGKIISRNVNVGNLVSYGDLLMTLDAKDVVEKTNQAEAQVSAAEAQLTLAKTNLERYSALFKENAVAAVTLDQYKTQYDSALANYNSAVAQLQQSKNSLGYTNLIADASGVISEINAETGQVVAAGQPVLTLIQTDELEVEVNVPENKISAISVAQPCTINFWANNFEVSGTVREISPMADSASRTFAVRITLLSTPSSITPKLGMTASATFGEKPTQTAGDVILPLSAIYQSGSQPQVWTVDKDNKVKLKNISVKHFGDNEVEVSGLKSGETVVIAGVHKLREGQEVRTEDGKQ